MLIKRVLREIYKDLFPRKFSLEAICKRAISKLRSEGATIGENVDIINCQIDAGGYSSLLTIGDNVTITNARILLHDASTYKELGYTKVGQVNIGNNVFIGLNSVILPNVTIGNKVIVGAGTIVSRDIPENSVVIGNPAMVVCTYDDYIKKQKSKMSIDNTYDCYPDELGLEKNKEIKERFLKNKSGFIK